MADPITQYATVDDLRTYALPEAVLQGIEPGAIEQQIDAASRKADSYLAARYALPLTAITAELRQAISWMVAYGLVGVIGYAPEEGQADQYKARYDRAIEWLEQVEERGAPGLVGASDSAAAPLGFGPMCISGTSRGLSSRGEAPLVVRDLGGSRGGFVGD